MNDSRFAMVEFQGDQLLTIFDGQTVRVAMKPLVEILGIDWSSQYKRILRDPLLSEGMVIMTIPSERGMQETATLPIELMHGWLFTLTVSKVREDARERVIAYQRECYQVLHDYWVRGAAINPRMAGSAAGTGAQEVIRLLEAIRREPSEAGRATLHAMLAQACNARGIDAPALCDLIAPAWDDVAAADVLERIDALLRAQPDLNRHRNGALIAVRGRDLESHGIVLSRAVAEALRRQPRFVATKTVNGRDGRSAHCWVFAVNAPFFRDAPAPRP